MSGRGGKKSSHGRPPKDKRPSQKGKGKDETSYAHLKGCLVVVELAQGIYEAVFHGTHKNPTGELILTFRHAQKRPEGEVNPNPNPFLAVLEATDVEVRDLKVVKQPPSQSPAQSQSQSQPQSQPQPQSDLKPKSSPNRSPGPGAGTSGSGKELQPWRPDEGEAQGGEALLEDLLKASRVDGERWIEEQFQKRETTFDMNNYTTALDKSSEFYKQHEERATKIAQEILSSQSDSAHVLSDRGQNVSVDEADLFSDVSADQASHNSAPTSTSAVGGTRGRKKDVPKARGQGFLSDKEISQRQRRDPPRGLNARNLLPQSPTQDSQTSTTNTKQADAKSSTSTGSSSSSASSTTSGVSSSTSAAPSSSLVSSTSLSAASSASTSTTASHSESVSHASLSKTNGKEASDSQDSTTKDSGDKQSGQDAKQSGEDAKQGAEDAKQGGEDAKGGQEAKAPEEKPKSKFKFNPKASTFLSRSAAEFVPSQPPLPGPGPGAAPPPPMFDGQWAPAPYSHPPEMSYQPGLTEGYHPQYHYAPPPVHMGMPPSPGMVAVPVPMSVPMPVPRVVMAPSPYSGYPPQGPMY